MLKHLLVLLCIPALSAFSRSTEGPPPGITYPPHMVLYHADDGDFAAVVSGNGGTWENSVNLWVFPNENTAPYFMEDIRAFSDDDPAPISAFPYYTIP